MSPRASAADPVTSPSSGRDRSRIAHAWYESVRWAMLIACAHTGGIRATGREHVPADGGVLIVSNHASFMDVFLLGITAPRQLRFVARASLFVPVLGPLIESVGAFPIDREGGGRAGLKEALGRLKNGSAVLLFPEGTRSEDGALQPLKPGFVALTRARLPIVPVGLAGTFEAWPRHQKFPRPYPMRAHYGAPIAPEAQAGLTSEALIQLVHDRLADALRIARAGLKREQDGHGS